ncbi:hypothetical protein [Mobiluncus mulieris]|uniref:hypothetical protein n=1 Tax=Mobiluncus mulieris TaxID=2052 RepID=UPI0021E24EA3|nr:hypothetical protein [Mobiluncus mulieris]MCV0002663.1 hypothetical protein [Mobiluncus mulieris]
MIIYKWFAIAQARHPRAVGRLMRLATSTIPKLTHHKHGGTGCGAGMVGVPGKDTGGTLRGDSQLAPHECATPTGSATASAASLPATLPPPAPKPPRDPKRTNGILAANYAARIPGAR